MTARLAVSTLAVALCLQPLVSPAGEPPLTAAERGWRVLTTKQFLPADFDDKVFDEIWRSWPEPLRSRAEKASEKERRELAFSRYGLMPPVGPNAAKQPALGYVTDGKGGWVMNCLACHGGKVEGRVIPGLPNSHLALQTLTRDVRLTKARLGKRWTHLDMASLKIPLGGPRGTTNAVVFGIVLGNLRDADMNPHASREAPLMLHHAMDAPPLWNVKKRSRLYVDGHAPKTARMLVQFMLLPEHSAEQVKGWEQDFADILAWMESLSPPKWPGTVDKRLAESGRTVFERNCSRCHGTYGEQSTYPERIVPLKEIGTDPVRLQAIPPKHLDWLKTNWMSRYGKDEVTHPDGYLAPPLDGVWASAPYFHNGSVPTLWHVLHPSRRPKVWQRSENGYDRARVGLEVREYNEVPKKTPAADSHNYYDTRPKGQSAAGHRFPDHLNEEQKRAVLEYLKTL